MSEREGSAAGRIRRLYRVLSPFVWPYRADIVKAYGALLGAILAGLLKPWPVKLILDSVLLHKRTLSESIPFLSRSVDSWSPALLVVLLCSALIAAVILESACGYLQKLLFARIGHGATTDVLEHAFTHVHSLHRGSTGRRSGDVIVRLTSDIKSVRDLLVEHVQKVLSFGLTLLGTSILMFVLDWELALLGIGITPFIWLVSWWFSGRIRAAAREKRTREGAVASVVHENLNAVAIVQAFAQEDEEYRRFQRETQGSLEANVESSRLGGAFNRSIAVLNAVGTAIVLAFGAIRVLQGSLTPGDLIVFLAYLSDLYKPVQSLSELSVQFTDSLVSGERVVEVIESVPRIQEAPDAIPAPRFSGEIVFDNVTFGYEKNCPVLRQLNFRVAAGTRLGLVGSSGAGKSTIVNLLMRFHDPWSGRILVDGEDIRRYQLKSLREQISVVLQEAVLFRRTVRANIAYGRPAASDEEVRAAARAARADEFIERMPEGYDTPLDESGANLSGGQRQRIAIARAFLCDAPILLMDEPTSELDSATEAELSEAMIDLSRGRTSLIIAHRFSTIEDADEILVLDQGRVAQRGVHRDLARQEGLYRDLYLAQNSAVVPTSER